jgi:uncharacterized repeat protein (TIGR03803 family)
MKFRILGLLGIAVFALATGQSRAANLVPLVSFNGTNGANPYAGLIADANGNLFGTTEEGGAYGHGTVFEIAKTAAGYASTPTTLVSFCAQPNCTDGATPEAGLIADANGNLFGTTYNGGAYSTESFAGYGTVFEIAKTAGGYANAPTTLVSFNSTDGAGPSAGLIADASGNLFGTTGCGGAYGYAPSGNCVGTVFEITKTAGGYASTPTTLVSFNGTDGAAPSAGLIADASGNLFGTTFSGGGYGYGTVFEITKTAAGYASAPTILVSFCSLANCADGRGPVAGLIADASGNLFGTTVNGGAYRDGGDGGGAVFEITKTAAGYASAPTILVSFCSLANCADGAFPSGGLTAAANGKLFGTTNSGGTYDYGTVFEIAKTAGGYASTPTTLISFNGTDGAGPYLANLIADASGNLFGTTGSGGTYSYGGTVFEITGSGFVPVTFAGSPRKVGCIVKTNVTLVKDYDGLNNAAVDLGYPGIGALEKAIFTYCWGV